MVHVQPLVIANRLIPLPGHRMKATVDSDVTSGDIMEYWAFSEILCLCIRLNSDAPQRLNSPARGFHGDSRNHEKRDLH